MAIHRKVRNLKVYFSDDEFQTLQVASSMSPFGTQGDFIAAAILEAANKEIESWRYTTTPRHAGVPES